jgi:hypothetical protein
MGKRNSYSVLVAELLELVRDLTDDIQELRDGCLTQPQQNKLYETLNLLPEELRQQWFDNTTYFPEHFDSPKVIGEVGKRSEGKRWIPE